jgi:uncharacterized protein (DUF58 family)
MTDSNRRTLGDSDRPPGRGLRLGLLIAGLALVVIGVVVIVAVPNGSTLGVVLGASGLVVLIAGPVFGRRRPPAA